MFYNLLYNLPIELLLYPTPCEQTLSAFHRTVFVHRGDTLPFKGDLDIKNSHDPLQNRSGYWGPWRDVLELSDATLASGGISGTNQVLGK